MKKIIFVVGLVLVTNILLWGQQDKVPNIIVILTDDQRWDAMGYAGNEIIQTPQMDRLAREGAYFENSFVTTPICAASRASIITGLYERTHQFTFRTPPLRQVYTDISYPKLLHNAGYRTGLFGKLGMNFENKADTVIFDELYNTSTNGYFRLQGPGAKDHMHLTDLTTEKAIGFIERTPEDQPFCLSISYNAAHADDSHPMQYFSPERNNKLYGDVEIPKGELHLGKYHTDLPDFLQDSLFMGVYRYLWRYDTPKKYQEMVKGYYRLLTTVDDNIGRLRRYLEDKGISHNTVIIFLGDNGYFLGERGLAGKWLMYENSLRVPLIIYDPGINNPQSYGELALNIDIAPTILDYAGIGVPGLTQGESLKPILYGGAAQWRSDFVCEHLYEFPYIPKSEGIRTNDWKYFKYIDHPETEELYNLAEDPLETNNLINEPGATGKLQELKRKLEQQVLSLEKDRLR